MIAIVLTVVIIWVSLKLLNAYTRHGSYIIVPDFYGVVIADLEDFASDHDIKYIINDSLYDNAQPKGSVIKQDPLPGTKVKKNRKIYLTVVALNPEQVNMPNLIDLTMRQALSMLETYGLKAGSLTYVPDIAHNAVLRQKFKGADIKEGTLIEKGSSIDLVLGKGEDNESTKAPDLFGKKQNQVLSILQSASLNIGNEIFLDGNDTTVARVYKQRPEANTAIQYGGTVDVWYRSEKKYDFTNNKNNTDD
ncbi:MAG: PASTA domain-containing protein [Bacteroidales bacterium]|nr:PASTA domain-containing protein [Bacteroidales bacterium]MDD4213614.1 PASTA domain-containing protein [Bacteroidales bacterium]